MPHVFYSYLSKSYDKSEDHVYNVSLGVYWLQYACNICLYVAQRDQYWNAYKFYFNEKILPMAQKSKFEKTTADQYVTTGTSRNYGFYNF